MLIQTAKIIDKAEFDWIPVEGQSMTPFLNSGDWIAVQWSSPEKTLPTIGEIILFRDSFGNWIVHRVISITKTPEKRIQVKGDSAFQSESLSLDHCWGKVVAIRKTGAEATLSFKQSKLDLCIAILSSWAVPDTSLKAKILRRIIPFISRERNRRLCTAK